MAGCCVVRLGDTEQGCTQGAGNQDWDGERTEEDKGAYRTALSTIRTQTQTQTQTQAQTQTQTQTLLLYTAVA